MTTEPKLIPTRMRLIRADGTAAEETRELPEQPTYEQLRRYVQPLLDGAWMERVRVFTDYNGGTQYAYTDMFVDEGFGIRTDYLLNEKATAIYRFNTIHHSDKPVDAETLSAILGPAVLFDRQVWF